MFSEENSGGFKLPMLKCIRCKHTWPPRTQNLPKVCPECKSPYWNTEKRVKKSEEKDENRIYPPYPCCVTEKRYEKDEDKV
jgi:predicted  nucleic acid-binding Zn-ribbon protein